VAAYGGLLALQYMGRGDIRRGQGHKRGGVAVTVARQD
jgi:hypothetical protein